MSQEVIMRNPQDDKMLKYPRAPSLVRLLSTRGAVN